MGIDIIKRLEDHGITTKCEKDALRFKRNGKKTVFTIDQLEELFMQTLLNQIQFQENVIRN